MIAGASNRIVFLAVIFTVLLVALGACGRKGSPKPPPGQESAFTYPQNYPAAGTVSAPQEDAGLFSIFESTDSETAPAAAGEEEPESILITPPLPESEPRFRGPPNVLPNSRTRTRTY